MTEREFKKLYYGDWTNYKPDNKMIHELYWQGEKVKVKFGQCRVTLVEDKPLYWYNYDVVQCGGKEAYIQAVQVIHENGSFCIANRYGMGIWKLLKGRYPTLGHRSLPEDSFQEIPDLENYNFDFEGFKKRTN